jgi:Flp pilus assembly pilin Flp
VTAIEYALIASLIAVFIIAAVQAVGTKVSTAFTEVGNSAQSDGRLSRRLIKQRHAPDLNT